MLVLGLQLSVDRALALKNAETLIFIKRNTPQSVYLREHSLNGAILFICNNVGPGSDVSICMEKVVMSVFASYKFC